MDIVFFVHASFLDSQSMPRFARMLADGMKERGHSVTMWEPTPRCFKLNAGKSIRKWLGYIDQFILFPREVKQRMAKQGPQTLYVFADQALGPWVPLAAHLPHAIHCHDFLAQRSALDEIPENRISWTGKQYQQYIRKGYSKGENFISVSEKTRQDLHRFLGRIPKGSHMVYNGLNQSFTSLSPEKAKHQLEEKTGIDLQQGFIVHVGGNQWYKNRLGVIEIYNAWRTAYSTDMPLLLIGEPPSVQLLEAYENAPFKSSIHFISGLQDEFVRMAYASATLLLFPSIAEGFGWPIAEAMVSGCPVITTGEAPMTEVAGEAGFFVARRPSNASEVLAWATNAAAVVQEVVTLSPSQRTVARDKGLQNVQRFDAGKALDEIEKLYQQILAAAKV